MKKYIDNDVNDELLLEIVNKINDSTSCIKSILKSIDKDFHKLITYKCLNYLLLLERLLIRQKLNDEVINYEMYINDKNNITVKFQESVKDSVLYHLEDVIDNIRDRLQYNNDFYYEIFSNPKYKQTRKYIFTTLTFTMNEPEFYTESKEYKYEVPMLYWNCFKYIFSYCIESEEFLKIFLKSMYEIEDTNKHIKLIQELLNNFELLDDEYFESTTKKQIISIMKDEIEIYKNSNG